MGLLTPPSRRALVTVALVVLVALAGCNGLSDLGLDDAVPGGSDGDASFAAVTANESLDTVSSFTLDIETRTARGDRTVEERQTIRAGDGRVAATQRRRITGEAETVVSTDSYSEDGMTYLRTGIPGVEAYSYERRATDSLLNGTAPTNLSAQFAFDHARTDDGDHLFTVDDPGQIRGDVATDDVRNVSVRVRVDDGTGRISDLTYHLELAADGGTLTYHTERTLSAVGETTVERPDWLAEAARRTGGNVTLSDGGGGATDLGDPIGGGTVYPSLSVSELREEVVVRRQAGFDVRNATRGDYTALRQGPFVHDGQVYGVVTGNKDTYEENVSLFTAVYAFETETMAPNWRFELPADHELAGAPTLTDGTVYLVGAEVARPETPGSYTLYAVDAATGEEQWSRDIGSIRRGQLQRIRERTRTQPYPSFLLDGQVAVRDGRVYVVNATLGPQRLLALDAESGDEVWRFDGVVSGVAHHEDRVYLGGSTDAGNGTYALDAATGRQVWFHRDAEAPYPLFASLADADGVYLRSLSNASTRTTILALDAEDGTVRWEFADGGPPMSLLDSNASAGTVFLRIGAQEMQKLDAGTGDIDWHIGTNREAVRWRAVAGAANVYLGDDYELWGVDRTDARFEGTESEGTWTVRRDPNSLGSNELSAVREVNGIVYTLDDAGTVQAYDADDGERLYEHQFQYAEITRVAVTDRKAYVGLDTGQLYALAPVPEAVAQRESATPAGDATAADAGDGGRPTSAVGPGFGLVGALAALLLGLVTRRWWA